MKLDTMIDVIDSTTATRWKITSDNLTSLQYLFLIMFICCQVHLLASPPILAFIREKFGESLGWPDKWPIDCLIAVSFIKIYISLE